MSTEVTDSAPFVKFMLQMIVDTLDSQLKEQNSNSNLLRLESQLELRLESSLATKIIIFLIDGELGKSEIAKLLGHKSISGELNKQISNLLDQQLIQITIPDKPTSSKQKYFLTSKAKDLMES